MKLRGAIFDMDGTLIDSMHIWNSLGADYIRGMGFVPPSDMHDTLLAMGLDEFCSYAKEQYGIRDDISQIKQQLNLIVGRKYEDVSGTKEGVREFLSRLSSQGVPMCIATATDREHVEKTLARCGILHFFDRIFTCSEVGFSKMHPAIFNEALVFLGSDMAETVVFEDSVFAAETAKNAGFKVVGVFDRFSAHNEPRLRAVADIYVKSFSELL